MKLARAQIEKNCLTIVPRKPRQSVENDLRQDDEGDAPARKNAVYRARIDLPADLVKRLLLVCDSRADRPVGRQRTFIPTA